MAKSNVSETRTLFTTCSQLNDHVEQIDGVADVVECEPDWHDARILQLLEHGPGDDDEQIVKDSH